MTRMRQPHGFHEAKVHNPEAICAKCGTQTPHVCEWCGACKACHVGPKELDAF